MSSVTNRANKLTHRNNRSAGHHSLYSSNSLGDHTQLLTDIKENTANINLNVDTLEVNTDGLEALHTSGNNTLSSIDNKIILPSVLNSDQLKVNDSAVVAGLSQINNNVDGLETTASSIATNTTGLNNCVSGNELQVDIVSGTITLPSGAATEAKQDSTISTLGDTNNKIDAMRGSNSLSDLVVKLNGGLPSALSSDNLKVIDAQIADTNTKIDGLQTSATSRNNTLSSIDNKVVLPAALDSGKLKVVDSQVGDVGNKIDAMRASDTLTTLKGVLDTIDADTGAIKTATEASATDLAALEVLQTSTNSKLDTIDTVLDNIKLDSAAIKTAVELLDNAISGSELQVDVVSAPTTTVTGTVTANLSATDNAVLDDIAQKLADVETAVQLIDNAISGSEMQVDVVASLPAGDNNIGNVDIVSSALPTGAATQTTLAAAEVHLGNIETSVQLIDDIVKSEDAAHSSGDKGVMLLGVRQDSQADFGADGDYVPFSVDADGKLRVAAAAASGGATEAKQDVIETTLTAIETDAAAIEVLLTGIDSDTDAIKTSVAALDNAVDGNYLNVNLNVAGTDVDGNSGNKSAASQRVVIATDDVNMSAIKTATEASATDLAALEVLQTSTNTKLDHVSDNLDTLEASLTSMEGKIDTLDAVQDNALTKLGEIDAVLDNIKVDTEAVETAVEAIQTHTQMTTVQMFDGETVNSGGDTHTSSATEIIKSPANGLNFLIKSSSGSVDAGDYTVNFLVSGDNSSYSTLNTTFKQAVNDGLFQQVRIADYVPKFIKMTITNNDFSSNSDFTAHLFY